MYGGRSSIGTIRGRKRSLPEIVGQNAAQKCGFSQNLWVSRKIIFPDQLISRQIGTKHDTFEDLYV